MNSEILMINKLRVILILSFIIMTNFLNGQTPIDLKAMQDKHKGNDVVYLKYNESIFIEPQNEDLYITDRTENELLFLTESASYYAQQKISYVNHVSSIAEIEAYTNVPKPKGGYKKVKVNEYTKNSNTSSDVFYDDVNTTDFVFPQPTIGAIGVVNYTEEIKDPHFLSRYYFASGIPIESAVFQIKVHKLVDLKYVLKNPTEDIKFTEVIEGNFKIYTWTRKNITKLKAEDEAKSIAYETPHIIVYIASYQGKTKKHKVLENTQGLYKFCYSLLDKGLETPDAALKRITDSVVQNVTTDLEKLQKIYYYVQDNINYIAFEDGLGGFIPRKPTLVCSRKYGDCKDIANLICTMLNYAGVPAYHTWVGTTTIPYKFSELPIMGVANHMIAAVPINNQWYFLDGTSKFLSYKYPSGFVQGKQAMIGINADSFLLMDIPMVNASVNITKNFIQAQFSGDTLIGKATRVVDGLPRCNIVSSVYYVPEKRREEFWKNFLELAQNNCTIDSIKITGMKGRDSLLTCTYNYKIPKYVTHFEDEVYVNLNLIKEWSNSNIDLETRTREFMFDEANSDEIITTFVIPKGYNVVKIPSNYSIDKGNYSFNFTYERKGNTIIYTQKYWFNTMEFKKDDFKPWNETIALLQKAFRQTLVLKKI